MVNIKEWLEEKYPKEKREEVVSLQLSVYFDYQKLEEDLDLSIFPNLSEVVVPSGWELGKIKSKKTLVIIKELNPKEFEENVQEVQWEEHFKPRWELYEIKKIDRVLLNREAKKVKELSEKLKQVEEENKQLMAQIGVKK